LGNKSEERYKANVAKSIILKKLNYYYYGKPYGLKSLKFY